MDLSWMVLCRLRVRNRCVLGLLSLVIMTTFVLITQIHLKADQHQWIVHPPVVKNRSVSSVQVQRQWERLSRATRILRHTNWTCSYVLYSGTGYENQLALRQNSYTSSYNGNMSVHHVNPFAYTRVIPNSLYILSAIGRRKDKKGHKRNNNDDSSEYIVLTGWISNRIVDSPLKCCALLSNGSVASFDVSKRINWANVGTNLALMAVKLICPLPPALQQLVTGISVSYPKRNCTAQRFVPISYPVKVSGPAVGICSKVVYGSVSARRLIEWMEIQRYMGVSKVVLYFYNLNSAAMEVLNYYKQLGFVELLPFDLPLPYRLRRYVGQKKAQPFTDEQVTVYDCMERLSSFTFAGVIDVDEMVVSRLTQTHNIKHLLTHLSQKMKTAGGFNFRTEVFVTDWTNKTEAEMDASSHFWHGRYTTRTMALMDRTKNFVVMDRVVLGSIWTHNYTAKEGYEKYRVPAGYASLKHYRQCRQHWSCFLRRRFNDTSVIKMLDHLSDTINATFHRFNITNNHTQP